MNIIGRLTRGAQIGTLKNDKQVVNFSVAVNDSYRNKQGEQVKLTEYFSCAYWISTKIAKVLTKGTLVELTGRVSAGAWIGGDGEAHAALNFHTSGIKLHGSGRKADMITNNKEDNTVASTHKSDSNNKAKNKDDLPF